MGKRSNSGGSVLKRKDGRRCAAYTVGGKRKYLYGKTRKEVAGKLREALAKTCDLPTTPTSKSRTIHRPVAQGFGKGYGQDEDLRALRVRQQGPHRA